MYGDKMKEGKKHSQKLLKIGALEKIFLFLVGIQKKQRQATCNLQVKQFFVKMFHGKYLNDGLRVQVGCFNMLGSKVYNNLLNTTLDFYGHFFTTY